MSVNVIRGTIKDVPPKVVVTLAMDERVAYMVATAVRRMRKRALDSYDPDFVPEPGRFDNNLARAEIFKKVIDEIEAQLP